MCICVCVCMCVCLGMYTCICVYRFCWSHPSVLRRRGAGHLLLSYQPSLAFVPVIDIHPYESYNNTFVLCMSYNSPCAMCAHDGAWRILCGYKSVVITSLRWVHHFCPPLLVLWAIAWFTLFSLILDLPSWLLWPSELIIVMFWSVQGWLIGSIATFVWTSWNTFWSPHWRWWSVVKEPSGSKTTSLENP